MKRQPLFASAVGFFAILAICASSATAQTVQSVVEIAESAHDDLEVANIAGENRQLDQVRIRLERALVAHPDHPALAHYLGYTHYRMATAAMDGDSDAAERHLEAAQEQLEQARELHDWPETQALLASVYGMRIGSNMMRGMTLGPKADQAMGQAHRLDGDNPRVWLLEGVSTLYKPRMFGGGVKKAIGQLNQALQLFASDQPESPRPSWGRAEIHVWLGMAHMKDKSFDDARDAFEAALELEPGYTWVSAVLLPELERTASGS